MHIQQKKRKINEDGVVTKVEEVTKILLVEETNKKEVHQIRDNFQTKTITGVVVQVEEEAMEENLKKVIFSVITVISLEKKMLMMVTMTGEERFKDQWYLDSGCSSHMTRRKDWFVNISPSMKNKVKFSNDNTMVVESICDVLIMRKDGKRLVTSNVLYIPDMESNFLSIGQLIVKNYKVLVKDNIMRVLESGGRLILNEPMFENIAFKIELNMMEQKCLETPAIRYEWLWHYRLGHLNFKDIRNLNRINMVS